MPDERLTKNDRRELAREQARLAREKQKRSEQRRRWLIPTGVTVGVVAIAAVVVLVVSGSAPAPQTAAGPKNMITDGILFTGEGGTATHVSTSALKPQQTPSPAATPASGVKQIVSYVDWSCPSCQAFEETNAAFITAQVAAGKATLEVRPVAILNRLYNGSQYSQRSNNAAACVANFAPDSFLKVQQAMYLKQPSEQSSGLTDSQIINVVHGAGLNNPEVDKCIRGLSFTSWVTAATNRFTSNSALANPTTGQLGTPTVLVDGHVYTGTLDDPSAFERFFANPTAG
ncbi:thioredoxin domain-containing protein [soil metagenome]